MDQEQKRIGNMFEFFITCGLRNMDEDIILPAISKPVKKNIGILTIHPSPLERKFSQNLDDFAQVYFSMYWEYCFPQGLRVYKQGDQKFQKIEECYTSEDDRNISAISDINYFVLTDATNRQYLYCTSAIFFEKMFLIDATEANNEKLIQVFIPKSFAIVSKFPAFVPQRSLLIQLLKIQKKRLNRDARETNTTLSTTYNGQTYIVDDSKIFDFFLRLALKNCPVVQQSCEIRFHIDGKDNWLSYHLRNNLLEGHFSVFTLSNNLFEVLIFNQPLYMLYKLLLYMLLEFQIIIVSRRPAGITLFCQSMIELLKPMDWKGIYLPYMRPNQFDFAKSKIPYIIGMDRGIFDLADKPINKDQRRVIYDIDDGRFLQKSDDIKAPKMHQNYLIRKLNFVFSELKFYENEYFEEGVLRFRQCFYNFILLLLNDIQKYFSQQPAQQTEDKVQEDKEEQGKKIVFFNYKKFLSSFDQADQPFFIQFMKTMIFSQFIKELYRAIEYRSEFIRLSSEKQIDYHFTAVLQFFDDLRFLSIRFGEQTLDDKFVVLENIQSQYIREVLDRGRNKTKYRLIEYQVLDFIPDYIDQINGNTMNLSTELKTTGQKHLQELELNSPSPVVEDQFKIQSQKSGPTQRQNSQKQQDFSDKDRISSAKQSIQGEENKQSVQEEKKLSVIEEKKASNILSEKQKSNLISEKQRSMAGSEKKSNIVDGNQNGSKIQDGSAKNNEVNNLGGPQQSMSHSKDEDQFSQMSSKLSNGEVQDEKFSQQSPEAPDVRVAVDQAVIHSPSDERWEAKSIQNSHISMERTKYQIQHLNLRAKKFTFQKLLYSENPSQTKIFDENIKANHVKHGTLIVTNLADKNLLQVIGASRADGANMSNAGRSYFNKSNFSLNPLVGDDNWMEIKK